MAVGPAVLGGEGAVQADDLKIPLKLVGLVGLLHRRKHPHGYLPHRAQAVDAGQADALRLRQGQQALHDFLAPVHSYHIGVPKPFVFHVLFLLFLRIA